MNWAAMPAPTVDSARHPDNPPQSDPDWDRFSFSSALAGVFEHYRRLRDALHAHGIFIDALDHLQYCERYRLKRADQIVRVQYWYKGNGKISRIAPVAGGQADSSPLMTETIEVMKATLMSPGCEDKAAMSPFVRDLVERLEHMISGTHLRIVSTSTHSYCLRIKLADEARHGILDFYYDSTPKWTTVREVGGSGKTGLVDQVRALLEQP